MHVVSLATTSDRLPLPTQEPIVRPLPGPGGAPVALPHVTLPAATVLPPHDQGHSYGVLIPLHGGVVVEHGGGEHGLVPGSAANLDVGQRIGVANLGVDATELGVVGLRPISRWRSRDDGDDGARCGAAADATVLACA